MSKLGVVDIVLYILVTNEVLMATVVVVPSYSPRCIIVFVLLLRLDILIFLLVFLLLLLVFFQLMVSTALILLSQRLGPWMTICSAVILCRELAVRKGFHHGESGERFSF